jgi:hypothetical protein
MNIDRQLADETLMPSHCQSGLGLSGACCSRPDRRIHSTPRPCWRVPTGRGAQGEADSRESGENTLALSGASEQPKARRLPSPAACSELGREAHTNACQSRNSRRTPTGPAQLDRSHGSGSFLCSRVGGACPPRTQGHNGPTSEFPIGTRYGTPACQNSRAGRRDSDAWSPV